MFKDGNVVFVVIHVLLLWHPNLCTVPGLVSAFYIAPKTVIFAVGKMGLSKYRW